MTMEREQLNQTLKQVQQQLHEEPSGNSVGLDAETRKLLEQLMVQVSGILSTTQETDTNVARPEQQTVLDNLLSFTEEFEESHPQLAATIGQMATALSRIGI